MSDSSGKSVKIGRIEKKIVDIEQASRDISA